MCRRKHRSTDERSQPAGAQAHHKESLDHCTTRETLEHSVLIKLVHAPKIISSFPALHREVERGEEGTEAGRRKMHGRKEERKRERKCSRERESKK